MAASPQHASNYSIENVPNVIVVPGRRWLDRFLCNFALDQELGLFLGF